jgi:hypothetical protein
MIKKVLSRALGKVGKYIQWSKYVVNFRAMPIVPKRKAVRSRLLKRVFAFMFGNLIDCFKRQPLWQTNSVYSVILMYISLILKADYLTLHRFTVIWYC